MKLPKFRWIWDQFHHKVLHKICTGINFMKPSSDIAAFKDCGFFCIIKSICYTLIRLGLANVITVLLYRIAIRLGIIERLMPMGRGYKDDLFKIPLSVTEKHQNSESNSRIIKEADEILAGNLRFFSNHLFPVGLPPDWFLNPINDRCFQTVRLHWSRRGDFDSKIGDIKCVWESSRFNWMLILARAYRLSGNKKYLRTLNQWIMDWTWKNPFNVGPNWKCGQEAAIRVMNLMLTSLVLMQDKSPKFGLIRFIKEHCERIEPTIRYAISQNNNHGTSEAAALFICGAWLKRNLDGNSKLQKKADRWEKKGRFWLENCVSRLIEDDGSFSQYSVNYHRLVVDTLCLVKFWQGYLDIEDFSDRFYRKAQAAVWWLFQMVDSLTGDAPNIGSNDGALLFCLTTCDYRDFRPSVQLGAVLFFYGRAYDKGPWGESFHYLGLQVPSAFAVGFNKQSKTLTGGGYVIFHGANSWGVIRIPNYRFRPGHADALHFDLWYKGRNVLRDGGTYSYNCNEPWQSYFPGTQSHNTIEFDSRDQMPRISRFLWGSWIKGEILQPLGNRNGSFSWSGAYRDYKGCRHQRTITLSKDFWQAVDFISGFKKKAVLRWRLEPGEWTLEDNVCKGEDVCIEIDSDNALLEFHLTEGWESRYYMEKTKSPILEVLTKNNPARIRSVIRLSKG